MEAFFLPGRQPRGFLLVWEEGETESRELAWRLSEQLQWEYNGIREEGLWTSEREEHALIRQRLRRGALFSVDGGEYCFYRQGRYQLYFGREDGLFPLLPGSKETKRAVPERVSEQEPKQREPWTSPSELLPDLCRGRGTTEGFYLLAPEPEGELWTCFGGFRRACAETQFQMAEYLSDRSGGLPAAFFYWQ